MPPDSKGSVTCFLEMMKQGEQHASEEIWRRFFPRLVTLAERTIGEWPHRMTDADDAVQSAFASLWRASQNGGLEATRDRDDLWQFLCVVTVRKVIKNRRRETAARRGGGKVVRESELSPTDESGPLDNLASHVATAETDLVCEEYLNLLDDICRKVAVMRLLGYKDREIALEMGCTQRNIERKLQIVRLTWLQQSKPLESP